ncbi:MAG: glycosyltransferase family 2 protein [Bryobacteraceae bacterium]
MVTPSFEQGRFLGNTINSVLEQEYPHFEYFVQDGGSTDNSLAILRNCKGRLSGWTSESDKGQAHAINLAFQKTSGDLMAWLNSDDLLLPGTLLYVADYFERHPDVSVIYGNRILINEDGLEIGRWILPDHDPEILTWIDYIPQETLFWRRSAWEAVGGALDESLHFALDCDCRLRARSLRDCPISWEHFAYTRGRKRQNIWTLSARAK